MQENIQRQRMERKTQPQIQRQKFVNQDEKIVDNLLNELHAGVPLRRRTMKKQGSMRTSRRTISKKDQAKLQAMCANAAAKVPKQNPIA